MNTKSLKATVPVLCVSMMLLFSVFSAIVSAESLIICKKNDSKTDANFTVDVEWVGEGSARKLKKLHLTDWASKTDIHVPYVVPSEESLDNGLSFFFLHGFYLHYQIVPAREIKFFGSGPHLEILITQRGKSVLGVEQGIGVGVTDYSGIHPRLFFTDCTLNEPLLDRVSSGNSDQLMNSQFRTVTLL